MGTRMVVLTELSETRFQVIPTRRGGWAWRLLSANNRTIANSADHFTNEHSCKLAIDSVRRSVPIVRAVGVGAWAWRLEGVVSPTYSTKASAERTATLFRRDCPGAPIHVIPHLRCPR